MLKIAGEDLKTLTMDHHGLVAAVCKDLKIAERIDKRLGVDAQRIVSPGQATVAMILNGLGFTNRRLYLTDQFFETKPVALLLGADIKAKDITDYTLGHTLDEIAKYGSSKLFGEVAFETVLENDLLGINNHLDTTSMTVYGDYSKRGIQTEGEPEVLEITYGHSKAHRPDLKQAVMSLVVNGAGGVPIFMEALSGNNSDKTSFHETIEKVKAFQKEIDVDKTFKWIADSALYTKDKLLKQRDHLWLTRVPESIKEARAYVETPSEEIDWKEKGNGYKTASYDSEYGGLKQRWVLVYSEQAYKREEKTFGRNITKKEEALKKELWHLGNEVFESEKAAESAFKKKVKGYKFHTIVKQVIPILKYAKRGKPKAGEEKIIDGYKLALSFEKDLDAVNKFLNRKGRFILATNDLDSVNYSDDRMLSEYKEQQKVEGGFRFLKDPWFMVDSIFLKLPRRIEALMMVMTLCLMVYNIAQYKLRETLKEKNETLPNQLEKQVKNPTLRWIFQIMEGINIVQFYKNKGQKLVREVISNLNELRKKIIAFFGDTACQIYGLIQKSPLLGLGM